MATEPGCLRLLWAVSKRLRDGDEADETEGGCDADAEVAPLEAGLLDDGDDGYVRGDAVGRWLSNEAVALPHIGSDQGNARL